VVGAQNEAVRERLGAGNRPGGIAWCCCGVGTVEHSARLPFRCLLGDVLCVVGAEGARLVGVHRRPFWDADSADRHHKALTALLSSQMPRSKSEAGECSLFHNVHLRLEEQSIALVYSIMPLLIPHPPTPIPHPPSNTETRAYSFTPATLPSSVPSSGGLSFPPVAAISFAYSSGVWHFALQACICAISSLSAAFTSRCRLSEFLPANSVDTMRDVKAWPQPPV